MKDFARFRKLLKEALKSKQITDVDFARRSGVDQSYVSKIKNGDRNPPSRDVILRMSKSLDLSFEEESALLTSAGFAPVKYVDAMSFHSLSSRKGRDERLRLLQEAFDMHEIQEEDFDLVKTILDRVKENIEEKK